MIVPPESHELWWCFSTLGCVDLSFEEICQLAGEFHIPGLELRGISGRMDMPEYCAEQGITPAQFQKISQQHQTRVLVVGTSVKLTSATEKDRTELLTFGAWAEALQSPYLRVFGGGTWGKPLTDGEYAHAVELIKWWRQEKASRQWRVDLLLETHDAFSGSEPCLKLNGLLAQPLYLIWDTHHTWRIAGESPESTWKKIGHLVRHVQVKDSVDKASARHPYTYVLPGTGQMPLGEVIVLLQREHYGGFVSLEWERHWHPYMPPLHEALTRLRSLNWYNKSPTKKSIAAAAATGAIVPGIARAAAVSPKK